MADGMHELAKALGMDPAKARTHTISVGQRPDDPVPAGVVLGRWDVDIAGEKPIVSVDVWAEDDAALNRFTAWLRERMAVEVDSLLDELDERCDDAGGHDG